MMRIKRLNHLLEYKPDEGSFYWKNPTSNRVKAGERAGCLNHKGYRIIRLDGKIWFEHNLVWLAETGKLPSGEIDHTNWDKADNRFSNLADVSRSDNHKNKPMQINNTSGLVGVVRRGGSWMARIYDNGKSIHLGSFNNIFDAACARKSAERLLGYSEDHGRAICPQ